MGFGKSFKKAWKGTLGRLEDIVDPVKSTLIGAGVGFLTGGPVGAGIGALGGASMDMQEYQQEKALKTQIASAEKIAAMQNNVVVSADPVPVQSAAKAELTEQNNATRRARAFRLSSSVRNATLGGGTGRKTLG